MAELDPDIPENKHLKQALNHLDRVLDYAPMVAEGRDATVHLTPEDWKVVADALFNMNTPDDALPDAIEDYGLANENKTITLTTADYDIDIEIVAS
jgi:hypothetical protein